MKNIHVLPTDKSSRLIIYSTLLNDFRLLDEPIEDWKHKRNIYITSDEEIKEGDWFLTDDKRIEKCASDWKAREWHKKIILTTDQDLIKDGVQAIDDEFLEWFVKNPSCERVEIGTYHVKGDISGKLHYKIIIPKEEPKQETLEEVAINYANYNEQIHNAIKEAVKFGAKWMEERMYTEEDMREAYKYGKIWDTTSFEEWFEQFKKK